MKAKILLACLCLCGCCAITWADLNDGLVAYYPFNGSANDESGNGRDGVVHGTTLTSDQDGVENSAYEFDGITDYMSFPQALPDMTEMTFWIWLNIPSGQTGLYNIFVDADGEGLAGIKFTYEGDDRVYLESWKSGARLKVYPSVGKQITNRWVNIAWVMTGEYSIVYVDGQEAVNVKVGGSNVGGHKMFLAHQYVGEMPFANAMKGKISSVRIYDRELSYTEIMALYEAGGDGGGAAGGGAGGGDMSLLYVDDDALLDPGPGDLILSDPNEDGTAEHPYDSIQEAIEVAEDGHKIVVRSGTYTETIDFLGKSVHVTGFDPNVEFQRNQPCPIIDANYQDTVVTCASGEDPNAQLSGFTITRGFGRYAGGIFCSGSHPRISNCLIVGNRSESLFGGGAVYCSNSNASFDNCTMSGNYGGQAGAGFYSEDSQNSIVNSILWGNLPAEIGFPMFGGTSTPPMLTYCDLTLEAYGEGNLTEDPLFVSPGFWAEAANPDIPTDAANADAIWIDGNYHLMKESPCIDAGDPRYIVDANQFDLDGHPRFVNYLIDMGADEYISVELNFTAIYDDISLLLVQDTSAVNPETTYVGTTTIQLDAFFKLKILGRAFAASDAGGTWTVTVSPDIIGPGMGIDVVLTIKGTNVDISKLTATSGDIVLADVELGGVLAP
jgi:hypothetical protein